MFTFLANILIDKIYSSFKSNNCYLQFTLNFVLCFQAPANSVIKDLDIHPTLDLVYLATGGGGLVEYNTISMEYRQLKGGSYVALQLDSMNK